MTKTLLTHADIITLDERGRVLSNADVAITDGVIEAVGQAPAGFEPDETVDARDHIIMPAFYNAHTHSGRVLLRGWAEDITLQAWLNDRVWAAEAHLSGDDVLWAARLAAVEMIRAGTAGFADQYFYADRIAEVALQSGLRANIAWLVFGLETGEIGADLAAIAQFVSQWQDAGDGRIRTMLGPHSPYACSPLFLARTAAVAVRLGCGVHIRAAETQEQVARSLARYDLTPIEVLDRNGILDVPALVAHGVWLSEPDRLILAAKGATVVQCPTSHMKLGMGVTPVPALMAGGVAVALGTDSPSSSGTFSMLREARQAALLQKLQLGSPEAMPAEIALRLATQHGARALGYPLAGSLAPGHMADLIMVDCRSPRLTARPDPVASLLYAAEDADISDLMVAGRWLMRQRVVLTLDEEEIRHAAARQSKALLHSVAMGAAPRWQTPTHAG